LVNAAGSSANFFNSFSDKPRRLLRDIEDRFCPSLYACFAVAAPFGVADHRV